MSTFLLLSLLCTQFPATPSDSLLARPMCVDQGVIELAGWVDIMPSTEAGSSHKSSSFCLRTDATSHIFQAASDDECDAWINVRPVLYTAPPMCLPALGHWDVFLLFSHTFCLSVSVSLSRCLCSLCVCASLSLSLSVCLSVCLSLSLSVTASLYLSVARFRTHTHLGWLFF
jgi:hypothetical protein